MNKDQVISDMEKSIESFRSDLSHMRTGRATPSLIENIIVSAYGGAQRLKIMELASIAAPDSESLTINPWDKSIIGEIKQAILAANVGLTPNIDGEVIRIAVPAMTGEERQKHVKILHAKMENARVSIRQIRGDSMKDIKKALEAKTMSEDESAMQEKEVQDLTDKYIATIEELGKKKEAELLQV